MFTDVSACNTYNYGDALYWDARYIQEANCSSFDWYQRYSALRPFIRRYISPSSRVLMVGCGNAVISEDMVKDGFEDIMNIDISSVAIEIMRKKHEHVPQLKFISEDMVKDGFKDIMNIDISSVAIEIMRKKHEHIPQLKYMQMDVRDMSFFPDDSFDSVIDKGFLNLVELYITYGDPTMRMLHINRPVYNWEIELYIIPKPGFQRLSGSAASKSLLGPVPITEKGLLHADYVLEDPDSHFIYVCKKIDGPTDFDDKSEILLTDDAIQR